MSCENLTEFVSPKPSTLSVVVPCYNEEEVIDTTHERLCRALESVDMQLDLVFVDDGSTDATANRLKRIQQFDSRVQVVLLARNFGHQFAVTAGIDHARGDAVVLIDADLQDPPEVILEMVKRWREGYDVVYGQRTERRGESMLKLITAKAFYRVLNWFSDTPIPLDTGDFRLMDRKAVDALRKMPEQHRFIRGMVSWIGFRQTAVQYKRAERFAGVTKYPMRRMLRLAIDAVLSFSLKPLRLASLLGAVACAASFAITFLLLGMYLITSQSVQLVPLLCCGMLLLGGMQLLSIGILGEYVGRIYRENQGRPLYLVRDHLSSDTPLVTSRQRHSKAA